MNENPSNKSSFSHKLILLLIAVLIVTVGVQSYFLYDLRSSLGERGLSSNEVESGVVLSQNERKESTDEVALKSDSEEKKKLDAMPNHATTRGTGIRLPRASNRMWDPFEEMARVQDEVTRAIDRSFGLWEDSLEDRFGGGLFSMGTQVNVEEQGDEVVVTAEIPNIKEDSIKIELSGNQLSLSGKTEDSKEEKNEEGETVYSQSSSRSFAYSVLLPGKLEPGSIEKKFDGNMLEVRVKKKK